MRPSLPWLGLMAVALLGLAPNAQAQGSPRSTLSGVYTAEQARRGKDTYAGMCANCHTAISHTGVVFQTNWIGKTLADLYAFISENMPKNDPGALSTRQTTVVLAYILKMNGMPEGKTELTANEDVLRGIRIEMAQGARPAPSAAAGGKSPPLTR